MAISERVDDMSVDEILSLPGVKPPRPLDRCAIRIGQARMGWYGPIPDHIRHAVTRGLPATMRPDGPVMARRLRSRATRASGPGEPQHA